MIRQRSAGRSSWANIPNGRLLGGSCCGCGASGYDCVPAPDLVSLLGAAGGLTAGAYVPTGSWTGADLLPAGAHGVGRFDGFPPVEATFARLKKSRAVQTGAAVFVIYRSRSSASYSRPTRTAPQARRPMAVRTIPAKTKSAMLIATP